MLDRVSIDDFSRLIGNDFHVAQPLLSLRLERVDTVMESERAQLKRQPFSLFFTGPVEPFLPQRVYELTHEAFPEPLGIFLVPIGRTAEGFRYEAVFT